MMITLKSGEQMLELVALAKGLIQPNDLANGGELSPAKATKLISMILKDNFLSKITTYKMKRLEQNVDVIDIARRQLVRVAQGQEPSDAQTANASEHGAVLRALSAQLYATLTLDFLRAHKDNPQLPQLIEAGLSTVLANDLIDLGFNGAKDDATGADQDEKFLNLNKGWLQIARDADKTPKLSIDPATDNWRTTLSEIKNTSDVRFRQQSVFLMSLADADAYAEELGSHVTGTPLTADSPLRRYNGLPIEAHPLMPQGHVLFTPLKNLAFGVHESIESHKEFVPRKRALEYTFDQAFDYEIGVKQAAVLAQPVV